MSSRVSPTDRIRAEIDALFTGGRDLVEVLEDVACLGAQLLIQTAVEAEVAEFLAVPLPARSRHCPGPAGTPQRLLPTMIKTTSGRMTPL